MKRTLPSRSLALLLLLAFLACATPAPESRPDPVVAIRPGINTPYVRNPDPADWARRFETESREIFAERHEIVRRVGIRPGMAVADVGAGTGLFTRLFAEGVGPTGRVFAVDILPSFLEHIRSDATSRGFSWVETIRCPEDSVALPAESIDLAFLCDTYHHFDYPRSSTASIHRALRPGGELVVIDFIRIEGVSRRWILDHVRAGKDVVVREIESVGFRKVGEEDFLRENWFVRFRKD